MKPTCDWKEGDVQELIRDQVGESLMLEYKACDALGRSEQQKKEVSKDVSSFANSAGGTIVYGVLEDKNYPTGIDVGYDPRYVTKEWLEQVINSNIQRRIDGVIINQVQLTASVPGRVLYVVSIPQSARAPHMAADNKFYKRFNFQSVPMEEYEVRDVARRGETPDLNLTPNWSFPAGRPLPTLVSLAPVLSNASPEPAIHAVIRLFVDARVDVMGQPGWTVKVTDAGVHIKVRQFIWGSNRLPLWEGEPFELTETPIQLGLPAGSGEYLFGWRIGSPRMPSRQQTCYLVVDGTNIKVVPAPFS
jgi:hypothetical protein